MPVHILAHQRGQNISPFLFLTITLDLFSLLFFHQGGVSQKLLNRRVGEKENSEEGDGSHTSVPLLSLFRNSAS